MKKILLTFLMLIAAVPLWAYDFEVDGIYYNIIDETNKTVEVTNDGELFYDPLDRVYYSFCYGGTVSIPSEVSYNGTSYSVTSIKSDAFYCCSNLDSVTIPNSVTTIGDNAFRGCTYLTSVTIPNSVTSIGSSAFDECTGLTEITIPNSVTTIGEWAFWQCTGLTEVNITDLSAWCKIDFGNYAANPLSHAHHLKLNGTEVTNLVIPNDVTEIKHEVFRGCDGLTSVTIPNSVTSIGSSAFYGCSGLTEVTIPNSVTTIGDYAFSGCTGLTEVSIPNSVTDIRSGAFSGCTGLTSVTIPNSVTKIGNNAFSGCTGLTSVTIPNSVTKIGDNAFSGCTGLTEVNFNAENCTTMGSSSYLAFNNCPNLKTINIGKEVKTIPNYAFSGCSSLTKLNIEDGVESISGLSFPDSPIDTLFLGRNTSDTFMQGKTSLKELTIGNTVTEIATDAFSGCRSLTKLNIEDGVESISGLSFPNSPIDTLYLGRNTSDTFMKGKTSLKELTIGNTVTEIATGAFSGCTGLTEVNIPNSVTSIGDNAFSGCTGLTSVSIPNSVTAIGSGAFSGCTGLMSVTIGNSVNSIGTDAFKGCSKITVVNSHNTTAPTGAPFEGVVKQSAVLNVPSSAIASYQSTEGWKDFANIREMAMNGNYDFEVDGIYYRIISLTDLTAEVVAKDDTYNSYSGEVVIPESVSYRNREFKVVGIEQLAFKSCKNLTSVSIPANMSTIGKNAFADCFSLEILTIEDSEITLIANNNFNNSTITSLYLGRNIDSWFSGCDSLTTVTIGNSVTSIGENAFLGCANLANVELPATITAIGSRAFNNCSALTTMTISANVLTIGTDAFTGCSGLKSLTIEDSEVTLTANNNFKNSTITSLYLGRNIDSWFSECDSLATVTIGNLVNEIGNNAFQGCSGLTEVTLGNSIAIIGDKAFEGCGQLTGTLIVPNSVTSVGNDAFYNCNGLTEVNISDLSVWCKINFKSINSNPLYYAHKLNLNDSEITDLVILDDISEIKKYTFTGCSSLIKVTIPANVSTIGADAFTGCSGLKSLTIEDSEVTLTANNNFKNSTIISLYLGRNIDSWFSECDSLATVTIGNSVTSIGENAFLGCANLANVELPATITAIGSRAFNNCSALTTMTISANVLTIGADAFTGCSGLKSLTIEDSEATLTANNNFKNSTITSLYLGRNIDSGFSGSDSLAIVTISNKVTSIGEEAFANCEKITDIVIPENVKAIGVGAFDGCSAVSNLIIKSSEDSLNMNGNTFSDSPLSSLYLGRTMTKVTAPFNGITSLSKVTLGRGMASLQSDAFTGCSGIKELVIEGGESAITIDCKFNDSPIEILHIGRNGTYAFNNRIDLKEVSISDNVTSLPANAFYGCSKISTLKLGNKLETIGSGAFTGCATLMKVYSTNLTPPTGVVFENKTYLQGTLYVVKGSKAAYEAADGWKEFWEIIDNLPFEVNGVWYNIDETGKAKVVANPSNDAYAGDVIIPTSVEVDGKVYDVMSIDAEAFTNAINVTSITIEDSEQPLTIGASATDISAMSNETASVFDDCMIESVYIGRNLVYQDVPFANITSLKNVNIGGKVTSMGGLMFAGCENIETVTVMGATPPTEVEFETRVYDYATLVVPFGSFAVYSIADGWKEFINIQYENGNVGVEDIVIDGEDGSEITIKVENGEIVVNGDANAEIAVYSINGGLIYQGVNRPVAVANKGVYIVIVNGSAIKVAL